MFENLTFEKQNIMYIIYIDIKNIFILIQPRDTIARTFQHRHKFICIFFYQMLVLDIRILGIFKHPSIKGANHIS